MFISKKKILLGLPIASVSLEIFLGVVLGYFLAKILAGKKSGQSGIIKSIILPIGKYRLHMHHWFLGTGGLISAFLTSFSPPFPQLSYGIAAGLIIQGVFSYSDWYKIFHK